MSTMVLSQRFDLVHHSPATAKLYYTCFLSPFAVTEHFLRAYFCSAEIQYPAIFYTTLTTSVNKSESIAEASFLMKWVHTTHLRAPGASIPEHQKPRICTYRHYIILCTSFQIFLTGQVLQSKFLKSKVAIFSVV